MSDRFLSDEDLDLRNVAWSELLAWWGMWLRRAQATNELDRHLYSHGVFRVEPGWVVSASGVVRAKEREAPPRGTVS